MTRTPSSSRRGSGPELPNAEHPDASQATSRGVSVSSDVSAAIGSATDSGMIVDSGVGFNCPTVGQPRRVFAAGRIRAHSRRLELVLAGPTGARSGYSLELAGAR